jgi:deazaflavin-dependent oxidoreductase (nitroreductase family)
MTDAQDFNAATIAEFHATNGQMQAGTPMVLVHHRGLRTGNEYIAPMVYLRDDNDAALIYVFASKAGAPTNPDWYRNIVAAGHAVIEVGADTYDAAVTEITGAERDRIYAEQVSRFAMFADYERKTAGIRTIPVIGLRRAS